MILLSQCEQSIGVKCFGQLKFLKALVEFLTIGWFTMPADYVFHERHAFPLCGVADQSYRLAGVVVVAGKVELADNFFHIVPVNFLDVPLESAVFVDDGIDVHDLLGGAVDLQAVLVEDKNQVVQPIVGGRHGRFPDRTFLVLAIRRHSEDTIIPAIEFRGQSHADCHRETLPQRTGGNLHSLQIQPMRVSLVGGA